MDRIEIKKYESQALAIAMVILVVSSLIGISIYSRSLKDKGLVLEERASAEALEVSDLILDKLTQYPINTVIDAIIASENLTEFNHQEGIVLRDNNSGNLGITSLLRSLGVLEQNISLSELINPLCPITTGSNEYQVTLRETDEHTSYEVKPGNVWSLPVKNLVQSNQCKLNLKFSIKGDSRAGFVLTYIYCKYDENGYAIDCKEYAREDIQNYCFSDDGIECNNENFLDAEWIKGEYNQYEEIDIKEISLFDMVSGGYSLGEIRVKAIFGTIGVSYSLPSECITGLRMYQLRATANCSGVYRGKEIVVPEAKWHNTLFDYVLFNGKGSI